jgi:predicted nuclease of predicted toxin-antitoxin system
VKFLVDAQLPPALAYWLIEAGCEAQAVREIGLREAEDGVIWRHAQAHGLVIVTKDEDFALRVQATESGPGVVWLRVGNTSNAALRAWFVPRVPQIVTLLAGSTRLVEIR